MHWISIIGFLVIMISICQAQSTTFKSFETQNRNKVGTVNMEPVVNNPSVSVPKSAEESIVHVNNNNIPSRSSIKSEKNVQNVGKQLSNTGNNNYAHIILLFIITVTMMMIHF